MFFRGINTFRGIDIFRVIDTFRGFWSEFFLEIRNNFPVKVTQISSRPVVIKQFDYGLWTILEHTLVSGLARAIRMRSRVYGSIQQIRQFIRARKIEHSNHGNSLRESFLVTGLR